MTKFNLNIECDNTDEFETLVARFLGSARNEPRSTAEATMPEIAGEAQPAKARRKIKAGEPTQNPDGTVIPPVSEPLPQPTPGGTDAPPAESIPPNQSVDPFAAPEAVAATPSASSPAAEAAGAAGEVTVQNLKDAMSELLKAKSASHAMKVLEEATGCKSLTSGSPSVAEKAKDDPGIMQRTLDALIAAKTAA